MKLLRWLLQIVLVTLVLFFGYHYFTREELRSCVSIPLMSLNGKTDKITVDQGKVDEFLKNMSKDLGDLANQGEKAWSTIQSVEVTKSANISEQLMDKGQYLYCKNVVAKVENKTN